MPEYRGQGSDPRRQTPTVTCRERQIRLGVQRCSLFVQVARPIPVWERRHDGRSRPRAAPQSQFRRAARRRARDDRRAHHLPDQEPPHRPRVPRAHRTRGRRDETTNSPSERHIAVASHTQSTTSRTPAHPLTTNELRRQAGSGSPRLALCGFPPRSPCSIAHQGFRRSLPIVSRDARSRCALDASDNG